MGRSAAAAAARSCGGSTGMAPPPAVTDTDVADVVIMAAGPAFTKTPMRIELIGNWK